MNIVVIAYCVTMEWYSKIRSWSLSEGIEYILLRTIITPHLLSHDNRNEGNDDDHSEFVRYSLCYCRMEAKSIINFHAEVGSSYQFFIFLSSFSFQNLLCGFLNLSIRFDFHVPPLCSETFRQHENHRICIHFHLNDVCRWQLVFISFHHFFWETASASATATIGT